LAQLPRSEYGKFPKKLGEGGNKISPGHKSRVAVARALFSDCDILILDEPTASLDDENKSNIYDIVFELNRLSKIKIILVTHDQTAIKRCDHVLRLSDT
jgi:ATP-binding cassette subfamily B protein